MGRCLRHLLRWATDDFDDCRLAALLIAKHQELAEIVHIVGDKPTLSDPIKFENGVRGRRDGGAWTLC